MLQETQIKENKRALLVNICLNNNDIMNVQNSLVELKRLAETADFEPVDFVYQNRKSPDKAYYIGKGFAESLKERMKEEDIAYLIFDDELSPSQNTHLEKDFDLKVIDRTELILHIFSLHAKTGEARLQIRLAELKYQLPRLKQLWTDYDRISGSSHGGAGFASRGSGEKKTHLDKMKIRQEMHQINEKLSKIMIQKKTQSKQREKINKICLVGYTNAGKSTLFNNLTESDVYVEDKLFATLDSTTRPFVKSKHDHSVIADTVGFIAKLPHNLVASFRATLKEAKEANLLLHVVDASDPNFEMQINEVNKVLKEIEVVEIPTLLVFNKIDQLKPSEILTMSDKYRDGIFISAKNNLNIDQLVEYIEQSFIQIQEVLLSLPYKEQKLLARLHNIAEIHEIEHTDIAIKLRVSISSLIYDEVKQYIVK